MPQNHSLEEVLSDRAKYRLFYLANQADIDPFFFLEYLINRHGQEVAKLLSLQVVPVKEPETPLTTAEKILERLRQGKTVNQAISEAD